MDWVPIKHQLDILRMDTQYVLRQVIEKTDRGKVYRCASGDYLPLVLMKYGLIKPAMEGPATMPLFVVTKFGRKVVDNDHAMREVAMEWMDYLTEEQISTLQRDMGHWWFRDPAINKFIQEMYGTDGAPTHGDFFPQAPWYWHTVGRKNIPRKLRDVESEQQYVQGGYTGKEFSAAEMLEDPNANT